MSSVLQAGAAVCAVLGLVSTIAVLSAARDLRLGVRVLLDFLIAAALLRLADEPDWRQLLVTAVSVAVRQLLARH